MKRLYFLAVALLFSSASFAVVDPIAGPSNVCTGSSITLTNATPGGTWSSSSTAIAVAGSTGTVFGNAAGVINITYTVSTEFVIKTISVNPSPSGIIGPSAICEGAVTTLMSVTPGGTWSSGSATVATIDGTGDFLGVGAGVTTVSYTMSSGCRAVKTMTVNPRPPAITGPANVCQGDSITLSNSLPGGVWSSLLPSVAMINTIGVVMGISTGSPGIDYTVNGCSVTTHVSVFPKAPITGTPALCMGAFTTLNNVNPGGIWTHSNPAVAALTAIGPTTSHIMGLASGIDNVTYTTSSGCSTLFRITILTAPVPIVGDTDICNGSITALSSFTPGGVWRSHNSGVAVIDPTGVVTGLSPGTSVITYELSTTCVALTTVTVYPSPAPITGPGYICLGGTVNLSNSYPGGSWSSDDTFYAKVSPTGVVTGIALGWAHISYTIGNSCSVFQRADVIPSSCSGTPAGGSTIASSPVACLNTPVALSLSGAGIACGVIYQWQRSSDGSTFTNIAGATNTSYTYNATTSQHFRCKLTCTMGGMSAYSSPALVTVRISFASNTITNSPDTVCTAPLFYVRACGISSSFNVTTWFGDETSLNVPLTSTGICEASFSHSYRTSGTYSIKQILYLDSVPQDTVYSTYVYNYCRTVPLKFYIDANANCAYDAGDKEMMAAVRLAIDSNGIPIDTVSATSGLYYKVFGPVNTVFAFRIISSPSDLHAACPASGIIYDTVRSTITYSQPKFIGFSCSSSSVFDLKMNHSSLAALHTQAGSIVITNNNFCVPRDIIVKLQYNPRFHSINAFPTPTSVSGNIITWRISASASDRYPFISYSLDILPSSDPWFSLRDTVNSIATVISVAGGEADTSNNIIQKTDTVRGSFDPNDIAVSPQGDVIPCTELRYTIRFENMGNDTARNIYVMDTLSDGLDINTLNIEMASAAMSVAYLQDGGYNIVKFDFPGINLLDSSHHNECQGMIVFNIKTKPGLATGTTIPNQAGIFFDDNPVVLTNIVQNVIGISPITGASSVCTGTNIYLNNATKGGVWTSSNTMATVGSASGTVTGISAGTNIITYTVSNACGSDFRTKAIAVHTTVIPSVNIAASPGDTVCNGSAVTFIAVPANGGTTPAYAWKVNGANVSTAGSYTYNPANGDAVTVTLRSNATCAIPDTSVRTTTMTVYPYLTPALHITASPYIAKGQPDTLKAVVSGAGPEISYQWVVNGTYIAGATSSTYIANNLSDGDSVTCYIITSNFCNEVIKGNHVIVHINETEVRTIAKENRINIYPNPNDGSFSIKGFLPGIDNEEVAIRVTDVLGRMVHQEKIVAVNGNIDAAITIGNTIAGGVYVLILQSGQQKTITHFILEK